MFISSVNSNILLAKSRKANLRNIRCVKQMLTCLAIGGMYEFVYWFSHAKYPLGRCVREKRKFLWNQTLVICQSYKVICNAQFNCEHVVFPSVKSLNWLILIPPSRLIKTFRGNIDVLLPIDILLIDHDFWWAWFIFSDFNVSRSLKCATLVMMHWVFPIA